MTAQKKSISRIVLALGGLLVGLPATTALAAEPATAGEAEAMAQEYSERAEQYRAQGGVGYKTGRVEDAEAQSARYEALAQQLAAPPDAAPVTSPEAQRYADLAASYRAMGGVAYKTGRVQWAEAEEKKHEPAAAAIEPQPPVSCPPYKQFLTPGCER